MSSTTLILQEVTIGTTRCLRAPYYEICLPLEEDQRTEYRRLRAKWVVVTNENGHRQLRIHWQVDENGEGKAEF